MKTTKKIDSEKKIYGKYKNMQCTGLEPVISDYPHFSIYNSEIGVDKDFIRADGKKIILNCAFPRKNYLFGFIIFSAILLVPLFFIISDFILGPYTFSRLFTPIILILSLFMPLYALYVFIKKPEISLTLDRENQEITFKTFVLNAETFGPYKVNEVAAEGTIIGRNGETSLLVSGKYGGIVRCNNLVFGCTKIIGRYIQAWSFILWYMDKNRPLPPNTFAI